MKTTAFSHRFPTSFIGPTQKTLRQSRNPRTAAIARNCHARMSDDVRIDNKSEDVPFEPLDSETNDSGSRAAAIAQAILDDLATRPEYYLNVFGVVFGIILGLVVLSATVVALDSLPLVPDALRMIGLVYLFWFLRKYLFSATERKRLGDEIDQFVAGVRGPVVNNIRTEQLSETDT